MQAWRPPPQRGPHPPTSCPVRVERRRDRGRFRSVRAGSRPGSTRCRYDPAPCRCGRALCRYDQARCRYDRALCRWSRTGCRSGSMACSGGSDGSAPSSRGRADWCFSQARFPSDRVRFRSARARSQRGEPRGRSDCASFQRTDSPCWPSWRASLPLRARPLLPSWQGGKDRRCRGGANAPEAHSARP
jgi:hypothetical protein